LSYRSRRFHRNRVHDGITVVIARIERLKRDLTSRSPMRRLRAHAALDTTGKYRDLLLFVRRRKAELRAQRRDARG
jgi:hypothetical protein